MKQKMASTITTASKTGEVLGIVLAGGKSRRFGTDKALAPWQEKNLLAISCEHLIALGLPVMISTEASRTYAYPGATLLTEPTCQAQESGGPLRGIAHAITTHPDRALLVIPCDMPLLSPAMLQRLLDHGSASQLPTAFSNEQGKPLPLPLYLPPNCPVPANAGQNTSIRAYLADFAAMTLVDSGPDIAGLSNINTQEEYNQLCAVAL